MTNVDQELRDMTAIFQEAIQGVIGSLGYIVIDKYGCNYLIVVKNSMYKYEFLLNHTDAGYSSVYRISIVECSSRLETNYEFEKIRIV